MVDEKVVDNMNFRVIGLRIVNKFFIFLLFLNLENNFDIIVRFINVKIVILIVVVRELKKLVVLNFINVVLFIVIGFGVDCDIVSKFKNFWLVIKWYLDINFCWINGSMV